MNHEEWLREDSKYCPKFDNPWSYFDKPPVFVKGRGSNLYDVEGKKYLDMVAGFACVNFGHANHEMVQEASYQMMQLAHVNNMISSSRILLAKELSNLAPINGQSKVYFDVGGTAATEAARKLVNCFTKKKKFISFKYGYHGRSLGALSLIDADKYRASFDVPNSSFICDYPYYYKANEDPETHTKKCLDGVRETVRKHKDEIGGIIVEPALGSSGYIFPLPGFYQGLRKICDENNLIFVDDEIQMGLGRTGKLFCCEHYGVKPDIMLLGKSLGGGGIWPLSAVIVRSDIADALPSKSHTSTFCGSPLGCGIGLKTLDYIRSNNICKRSEIYGSYLKNKMMELKEEFEIIGCIEGKGLAVGLEFVKNQYTKEPAIAETKRIIEEALKKGLLLQMAGIKNRIILCPSLFISKDEIDEFIYLFDKSLSFVDSKVKKEILV